MHVFCCTGDLFKIFLNAKGTLDDVSDELKAFLDYVAGKKPKDAYVERLEKVDRR